MPLDQTAIPFMWPRQLVVRTDGDPLALAPAVRRAIWDVDPNQPVSSLRAMSEVLDSELNNRDTAADADRRVRSCSRSCSRPSGSTAC